MVKADMERGERSKTNPLLAGVAFLGALLSPFESFAQQTSQPPRGRPITQAEFEATLSPEERAARRAYEERERTDPVARAAAIARERRQAQLQREGEAYCRRIEVRIKREGYAAVEADIGGMGMSDCNLIQW